MTDDFDFDSLVDAVDRFADRVDRREEVAYAEIGGRTRTGARVVVTGDGSVRSATPLSGLVLGCRVFAHGHADYRAITSATADAMDDVLDRALRTCKHTANDDTAVYDPVAVHRDVHDGWAASDGGLDALTPDAVADEIGPAVTGALDGATFERARVTYEGGRLVDVTTTTTGSTVRTTRDRASVSATLVGETTVTDHVGSCTGRELLEGLQSRIERLRRRAERQWALPVAGDAAAPADPPDGSVDAYLGPLAAARVFHAVSRYLEADTALAGSAPFAPGDRLGPDDLTIVDEVGAGSWGSVTYDAAARPTSPVRLVADGRVRGRLHDATTAAAFDATPSGNLVRAVSTEDAPRIAARHLRVEPGSHGTAALRDGADVELTRLGEPTFENEATRTKRESRRPPYGTYARRAAEQTPDAFADEPTDQLLRFPVEDGVVLAGGDRVARFEGRDLLVDPNALADALLGSRTDTLTGTTEKHGSRLPLTATAPETRLDGVELGGGEPNGSN